MPLNQTLTTEKDWQGQVEQLAARLNWRFYHTHNSRHSGSGFPDLVLVRRGRLIFAELKTDAKASKVTDAQAAWLTELKIVQDLAPLKSLEVFVWRPSQLNEVLEALK